MRIVQFLLDNHPTCTYPVHFYILYIHILLIYTSSPKTTNLTQLRQFKARYSFAEIHEKTRTKESPATKSTTFPSTPSKMKRCWRRRWWRGRPPCCSLGCLSSASTGDWRDRQKLPEVARGEPVATERRVLAQNCRYYYILIDNMNKSTTDQLKAASHYLTWNIPQTNHIKTTEMDTTKILLIARVTHEDVGEATVDLYQIWLCQRTHQELAIYKGISNQTLTFWVYIAVAIYFFCISDEWRKQKMQAQVI